MIQKENTGSLCEPMFHAWSGCGFPRTIPQIADEHGVRGFIEHALLPVEIEKIR